MRSIHVKTKRVKGSELKLGDVLVDAHLDLIERILTSPAQPNWLYLVTRRGACQNCVTRESEVEIVDRDDSLNNLIAAGQKLHDLHAKLAYPIDGLVKGGLPPYARDIPGILQEMAGIISSIQQTAKQIQTDSCI